MVNVLIPTKPDDPHALFVKIALAKKGHHTTLWYTADFPQRQTHCFELKNDTVRWSARGAEFAIQHDAEFDVVWLRRPRKPVLPDYLHADDVENAQNENMEFYKTFWQVIAPNAFWINSLTAMQAVNCKLRQLAVAKAVGFTIPHTLVTNDPKRIKAFIAKNGPGKTIYKSLFPTAWVGEEAMHLTYTSEVYLSQLPTNPVLQSTAGIFQKKILKDFELRVTFFGDCCIAAKIHSQAHSKGRMDWRYVPTHELMVEEFVLPDAVFQRCRSLMRTFGIVFGCFDFIVTPEQEYYFLEVNEQGQFLWLEDVNPHLKMLDTFTDFIISGGNDFKNQKVTEAISLREYYPEMLLAKAKAIDGHVAPGTLF